MLSLVSLQGEPALLEGVLLGEPVSWCPQPLHCAPPGCCSPPRCCSPIPNASLPLPRDPRVPGACPAPRERR